MDSYLDSVLIGGREPLSITIVEYDVEWPRRFGALARRVVDALDDRVRAVQHIGSTSVPGLAAKAIIDMLLTLDNVDDEAGYVPDLEACGFALRVREPNHRMFRTRLRDAHLHVYEPHRPEVAAYLDLRDWLRVSPEDRTLYAETKRRLAQREWTDMNYYADAKSEMIAQMLMRATAWRADSRGHDG